MDKSLDLMIRMGENVINENFLKDFSPHTKNKAKLVPITETNAMRLLDRHTSGGYAIVSPCRGFSDFGLTPGVDDEKLRQINNKRVLELYQEILNSGYSFTPCYGGFIEGLGTDNEEHTYEKSFIIYSVDKSGNKVDFDEFKEFIISVGRKYNQDAVLICEPGKAPSYYNQDGAIDMTFTGKTIFNDASQEYFTDLHKNTHKSGLDGKPTRFTFNEVFINPAPQCLSEAVIRGKRGEVFIPYLKG